MGIAALAMAASIFAVDFSATVKVKGDVAYGSGKSVTLMGVENTNQKDNDLLEVNFNGDKAGAFFRMWATAKESAMTVRALKVWFAPVDGVKVTVGNNDLGLYTERINWWKVPCAASLDEFGGWDGRWASGAGVHENFGATAEITAISNLYIGLGVSDGFLKLNDGATWAQCGAVVKYQIMDNLSAGAAWRCTPTFNLATIGVEFGNWGTPYYGFVQGKLRMDDSAAGYWGGDKKTLAGVTVDNYVAYNFGAAKVEATVPVTIRLLDDPSYMTARVKVSIPTSACGVYIVAGSDEGTNNGPAGFPGATVWNFDDFAGSLNIYANVGATFNVGSCGLDLGVEVGYDKASSTTSWAIPFAAQVAF